MNKFLAVALWFATFLHASSEVRQRKSTSAVSLSSSSGSDSQSGSESSSSKQDHYSATYSEEELAAEYSGSSKCCLKCLKPTGCGKKLSLNSSPAKTGILAATSTALSVGFSAAIGVIDANLVSNCYSHFGSMMPVKQCYPSAWSHLVGSIAGLEPVHLISDIGLFVYGILYVVIVKKSNSLDRWDFLLALGAFIFLIARILGTIGTVFLLPGQITEGISTSAFKTSLGVAAGCSMGLEVVFLLFMIGCLLRDLNRRVNEYEETHQSLYQRLTDKEL